MGKIAEMAKGWQKGVTRGGNLKRVGTHTMSGQEQTNNIIYEGKYPMAANSETTSIASSPWDMQTNAQSQRKFEEKVEKQRRNHDWKENRATLDVEECSFQASRDRDSGRPKTFNHANAILKNDVALSRKKRNDTEQNQKGNSLAPHSIGVKRVYVYDDRKDGKYRGIKTTPGNDAKRFKDTELTESIDQILKYTETPVERCTGSAILGSPRTELDNKAHRNNPLNMVAEQRLETHDEELLAYHYVIEAFYAVSGSLILGTS